MDTRSVALLLVFHCAASVPVAAQQFPDSTFNSSVARPAHVERRPVVLLDGAHRNLFTEMGRINKFVELLASDGLDIITDTAGQWTSKRFDHVDVVVVTTVRALPPQVEAEYGPAFRPEELDALERWVRSGGSLLVAADHYPFDEGARPVLGRFGVIVSIGVIGDTVHFDRSAPDPRPASEGWIVYSRENGLLGEHPITTGRDATEKVDRVLTFGGSSVSGPPHAVRFLRLPETATNRPRAGTGPVGLGDSQGIAFTHGEGRVVVLGDATMITAQRVEEPHLPPFQIGMGRPGNNNRQLALNIVRWLTKVLPN